MVSQTNINADKRADIAHLLFHNDEYNIHLQSCMIGIVDNTRTKNAVLFLYYLTKQKHLKLLIYILD